MSRTNGPDHDESMLEDMLKAVAPQEMEPGRRADLKARLLARIEGLGALRAKGFVETRDGLRVVQGVGARIELDEPRDPPPPEIVGRVVVIRRA